MSGRLRSSEFHVLGVGALSGAGACAATAAGVVWTGLSRLFLYPEEVEPGELQTCVARADYLDRSDLARLGQLLEAAVYQALEPTHGGARDGEVPVFLALPAHRPPLAADFARLLDARVAAVASPRAVRVVPIAGGGASALVGLARAVEALRRGDADVAVVAVADSLVSDDAMDPLVERGRLLTSQRGWGLAPGEGAAAFLIGTDAFRRASRLPAICGVTGVGIEGAGAAGSPPAARLASAIRAALAPLGADAGVRHVFCDLNGERARGDEWAITAMRVGLGVETEPVAWSPATCWGDAGVASGGLLLASAATILAARWTTDPVLVWSMGDDGTRAAAVLSPPIDGPAGDGSGRPRIPPSPRPGRQARHDRALLREMLDSAAALYEQRKWRLGKLETASLPDWTSVAAIESRIDRHVDALLLGWDVMAQLALEGCRSDDPGAIYTAARVLAAMGRGAPAVAELASVASDREPPHLLALADALLHDATPAQAAQTIDLLAPIDGALPALIAVAARCGAPADVQRLNGWIQQGDDRVKADCAAAWLFRDARTCAADLRDRPRLPWTMVPLVLAGAGGDGGLSHVLGFEATHAQDPRFALALGLIGDLGAVQALLRLLALPGAARWAALALALATGATPTEESIEEEVTPDDALFDDERARRAAGDRDVGVTRTKVMRVNQDASVWTSSCRERLQRSAAGARLRMGLPHGPAADVRALICPVFPPSWRRALADSLALGPSGRVLWSDGWVARQRALLAAWDLESPGRRQEHGPSSGV